MLEAALTLTLSRRRERGLRRDDPTPAGLRSRQRAMRRGEMLNSCSDVRARGAGTAGLGVDVKLHLLGAGEQRPGACLVERMEEMDALLIRAEDLRRHLDPLAARHLAPVHDVRLDRVIAQSRRMVGGIDA